MSLHLPIDDLVKGLDAHKFGNWNLWPEGRTTREARAWLGIDTPAVPVSLVCRQGSIHDYIEPEVIDFLTSLLDAILVPSGILEVKLRIAPYDAVRRMPEAQETSNRRERRQALWTGCEWAARENSLDASLLGVPLASSVLSRSKRKKMLQRTINKIDPLGGATRGVITLISPADYLVYTLADWLGAKLIGPMTKEATRDEYIYLPGRVAALQPAYLRREIAALPKTLWSGEKALRGIFLGDVIRAATAMTSSKGPPYTRWARIAEFTENHHDTPEAIVACLKRNVLYTLFNQKPEQNPLSWWETMLANDVLAGSEAQNAVSPGRVLSYEAAYRPVLTEIYQTFIEEIPPLHAARDHFYPPYELVFPHEFARACVSHARQLVGGPAAELVAMAHLAQSS